MNSPVTTRATFFIRIIILGLLTLFVSNAFAQWKIDFSRRNKIANANQGEDAGSNSHTSESSRAADRAKIQTPTVETVDVTDRDLSRDFGTRFDTDLPRALPGREEAVRDSNDLSAMGSSRTDKGVSVATAAPTPRAVRPLKDSEVVTTDVQDVVLLHTEQGFVPSSLRVRIGSQYRLHVVNVSNREKNISFVLDAFAEHHSIFFGQDKVVNLIPQREGIFQFQCPETAMQGKLVVLPSLSGNNSDGELRRVPANRDEW